MRRASRTSIPALALLLAVSASGFAQEATDDPLTWPEEQRAFFQDGPALLLDREVRDELRSMDPIARGAWIQGFLDRDPIPETPENELQEGLRRRALLVRSLEFAPQDDRGRLVFLLGEPLSRRRVDCSVVFNPLEIWTYGDGTSPRPLILYETSLEAPYRLWVPLDSKRPLYTEEMEYFLDQWEELRRRVFGRRFDHQICKEAKEVDEITGISGLTGYQPERPTNADILRFLGAPDDLAAWSRAAAATPEPELPESLAVDDLVVQFPQLVGQRMVTRISVTLPADAEIAISNAGEKPELGLALEGTLEHGRQVFDSFRVRFDLEPPEEPQPLVLVEERALRPGQTFLLRLQVRDEIGAKVTHLSRAFTVPNEPEAVDLPPAPPGAIQVTGQRIAAIERIGGRDTLLLVPPDSDVVLGLWRAEALVTGDRIDKVVFLVDGEPQLSRSRAPFSAEIRLAQYPREQVVRAEGYDADGNLIDSDEVILNQPRGALRVRILEPRRGTKVEGKVKASAEVVVPEDGRIENVEFLLNDERVALLQTPPWEAEVEVPVTRGNEIAYLTVVATLDDESRAEDVRFLNDPEFVEQVEVSLTELFVTVTDRSGRLVRDLGAEDFEVFEDGRRQEITKFELVEDLPLNLGITIDTSGSMNNSIGQAERAATGFIENIITRRDRCFTIAFSNRPLLLMPPTDDTQALALSLEGLRASGFTSLYDAVVHSLYYFRGVSGRRALVVLSDGEDTSSNLGFAEALDYARRTGVVVYTIGLGVGALELGLKDKLRDLAQETGGRTFLIRNATELEGVYQEIEDELRSQYLVAYPSTTAASDTYRPVEVKVKRRGLDARTARGVYP